MKTWKKIYAYILHNGQTLVNIFLVLTLGGGSLFRVYQALTASMFDYIEVIYFIRNLVLVIIIMNRLDHLAISKNYAHQSVALIAFFTGIAFDPEPTTDSALLINLSRGVTIIALLLATITLINLGKSFGILISIRQVKHTDYTV
ncbi:hypothetical protein ACFL27_17480 [candidate division CSSED10-310 bacterium]|uniref:Uncharacterized protein n=1 Tax=candidate division CSSED10-310 bacterium TaxID=2855610 RepID=A0ABV6Z0M3_UNCC1